MATALYAAGRVVAVGSEYFGCLGVLFNASLIGKEASSIYDLAVQSVMKCEAAATLEVEWGRRPFVYHGWMPVPAGWPEAGGGAHRLHARCGGHLVRRPRSTPSILSLSRAARAFAASGFPSNP